MQTTNWLVLACAVVLAACGSEEKAPTKQTASTSKQSTTNTGKQNAAQDMTAEQVAKEARGNVKCPAKIASPAPSIPAAVDVVGVRPGMTYEEAEIFILCTHDLLVTGPTIRNIQIQTYGHTLRHGLHAGFAQPKVNVQRTARDYRRELQNSAIAAGTNQRRAGMQPGTASWYVGTMGMPGEERVINVARKERFEDGRQPTMASVRAALVKKYGEPIQAADHGTHVYLYWSYDTRGRRIAEASPLFGRCHAPSSIESAFSFSPDCGFAVTAAITAVASNRDLADELSVMSLDQAGGYEALDSTERGLAQLDAQRRAKETEAASRNATAPTL